MRNTPGATSSAWSRGGRRSSRIGGDAVLTSPDPCGWLWPCWGVLTKQFVADAAAAVEVAEFGHALGRQGYRRRPLGVITPMWLTPALMFAILLTLFVGDHPSLYARSRSQTITLDQAYPDERDAAVRLQALLGADIRRVDIRKLDLVNDTTVVDVRFDIRPNSALHDDTIGSAPASRTSRIGGLS